MSDETAVFLNISDMIDLAIGTPEVGVVDFCMLQTVLHCLAQQLRVLGKNVELRGSVAALPLGRENSQTIAVSEFLVDTDKDTQAKTVKEEVVPPPAAAEPETILVVERIRKVDSPLTRSPQRTQSPPPSAPSPAPPRLASAERLSLVTLSKFHLLESAVDDLKSRVYGSMPKNEEILQEVRSQTNLKAITDMWTSLNVSSRLEAAEAGIAKLSSLVQDIISDTAGLQDSINARRASREPQIQTIVAPAPVDNAASKDDLASLQQRLAKMKTELDNLTNSFNTAMADIQAGLYSSTPAMQPPPPAPPPGPAPVRRATEAPRQSFSQHTAGLMERLNELEKRLQQCCDDLGKKNGVLQDQINSFQDQIEYLSKQVAATSRSLQSNALSPDMFKDIQGLMSLFQTVQEMQEQLKQVHETALQLAGEKEDRLHNMNSLNNLNEKLASTSQALLEQIELLKTVKLDREDMAEAMADKADLRMLARKVSRDQFELACDDLSRGLEHALGKLNMQESLWQQALDDIQREIEMKLDKLELSPVKDFFNNKLRQLQENLKQMAALRREAEAAGTKRKLLRDVNCISCDARAVMPMEAASSLPLSRPMPANLSMKPYLSYELDAIRKSQATNLPQRNMKDWEDIEKQMEQRQPPPKPRSDTDKHLCNRYCGGSHTTTTAAQRVARLGHFVKQWGPDVVPLSSGLAAGDDGRMYKVTTAEGANVGPGGAVDATCTPRTKKRVAPTPQSPQKPILVNPDCRCLEGDRSTKG